jgi:predicted acyltransferase
MSNRIAALDAFRGFTVAAMLLVNNPGSWSTIYPPLRHAAWHGWTPTDLIFPFFLFVVGITTELAPKEPRGIVRRGALIFLCGFALHLLSSMDFSTVRIMGVLQRIGIVYVCAAFLAYAFSRRAIVVITAIILLGYWAVSSLSPLSPPAATLAAQIDRAVLGEAHLWKQSKTWDPEGLLSTIPAIATALLGILVTPWVRARNVKMLTIVGAALFAAGLAWGAFFPINKALWTSSYVLLSSGAASVMLAAWISKLPARPFDTFGVNPLVAFVGSGLMATLLGLVRIGGVSLKTHSFRWIKPWLPLELASLIWALLFVLVWYAILRVLQKRRIFVRF